MNDLEKFVEEVKQKTKGMQDIEIIRYVYIKLGLKMSFDLAFSFGNKKQRLEIYRNCIYNLTKLEEDYKKETIICKSLSFILEYVLKELGFQVTTGYKEASSRIKHTYNVVLLPNNEVVYLDLQEDLENIQFRLRPKNFKSRLNRKELEEIDLKIGYITKDNYYRDEFLEFLKYNIEMVDSLEAKISLVVDTICSLDLSKYGYAEVKFSFQNIIDYLFKNKDKRKIFLIDICCNKELKQYAFCIACCLPNLEYKYFIIEPEKHSYRIVTKKDLEEITWENFKPLESIPGLKKVLV